MSLATRLKALRASFMSRKEGRKGNVREKGCGRLRMAPADLVECWDFGQIPLGSCPELVLQPIFCHILSLMTLLQGGSGGLHH